MRSTSGLLGSNPSVTIISKILVIAFVLFCALQAEQAGKAFEVVSGMLLQNTKWFYLLCSTSLIGLLLYIMCSRYGLIRLGKDNEKPEYSLPAWICMLFSCGMGVGLLFWSVAEPMWHYASNPFTSGLTDAAATKAMQISFFHWGLHPWSLFCMVAVALGFFSFRKDLPFSLRSILYPVIGNRIYGPIGHTIDILTIVITAFGISQTMALGVLQINSGLNQVFGLNIGLSTQLVILICLSTIATASVIRGIGSGMRRLSELNILISIFLILILLYIGPTRYLIHTFLESTADYTSGLISMSLWSDTQIDSGWQNWWTAFYWPWWMTWAPFVGMFIAKISRGRSLRQVIAGALILPSIICFFWISVLGGSAMKVEQNARHAYEQQVIIATETHQAAPDQFEGGPIVQATKEENTRALFTMFNSIDNGALGQALSIIACILLLTYLVTSQDAGTHVLCFLDTAKSVDTPVSLRLLWSILVTCISAGLLYAGGVKAIQTASIIAGFPIAIMLTIMAITLFKSLRREPIIWEFIPNHARPDFAKEQEEHSSAEK